MPDPTERLWKALEPGGAPLVIVLYGDMGLIDAAREAIEAVADPSWPVADCHTVDEALVMPSGTLVRLLPRHEASAIRDLEGNRERFIDRIAPVVVLLRRQGEGVAELAQSPSLGSWVRDRVVDLAQHETLDVDAERARFQETTGLSPEEWLVQNRGIRASDDEQTERLYWALTLERRHDVG